MAGEGSYDPTAPRSTRRLDERAKIEAIRTWALMVLYDTRDIEACDTAKVLRDVETVWRIAGARETRRRQG